MALIRIDWNPSERKVRQFGLGLAIFSLLLACWSAWKGHGGFAAPQTWRAWVIPAVLGLLCAALPGPLGRPVYRAWMGVSWVIGTAVSEVLMALLFYGMLTPLALISRAIGRDALRLKRPAGESYWTTLTIPKDKSYLRRLF